MKLDKKDRLILDALQANARQSLSALGKRIGLSQPAVSERVRKLEDAGVIRGYAAQVDLRAVGLPLQAVVRIRTTHEHITRYVALLGDMPEVIDVVRVTGEDCFIVRCAFAEPADLERVVDRLAAHGSVTTALVLSQPLSRPPAVEALTGRAWRRRPMAWPGAAPVGSPGLPGPDLTGQPSAGALAWG